MENMDLVIRGGLLVDERRVRLLDLGIRAGRVAAIGRDLQGTETLDVPGCYVFPGLVDPHVHLSLHVGDLVSADDFCSGTVAAACGGVTTLLDFTGNTRGESLAEALRARVAEARGRLAVDLGLHLTLADASPAALAVLPALAAAGHTSAKLYMAYDALRLDDGEMLAALAACRDAGMLPMVHAENYHAAAYVASRLLAEGCTAPRYQPDSRPALVEAEGTHRVLALAALTGAPLYLAHISCRESLAELAAARARGQAVAAETCPHYLTLDRTRLEAPGPEGARYV